MRFAGAPECRNWPGGVSSSGGRDVVCGPTRLQLEDRVVMRQIVKGRNRRSLGDREEALHLARETVEIGFEDRRPLAGGKLAHGIIAAAAGTDEHDLAGRGGVARPVGVAAAQTRYRRPSISIGSTGSESVRPLFRPRTSST